MSSARLDRVEIYNVRSIDHMRVVISMPLDAAKEIIASFQDANVTNPKLAEFMHDIIVASEQDTYAQRYMEKNQ